MTKSELKQYLADAFQRGQRAGRAETVRLLKEVAPLNGHLQDALDDDIIVKADATPPKPRPAPKPPVPNFTGTITDSLGRKQYYLNGEHVRGPQSSPPKTVVDHPNQDHIYDHYGNRITGQELAHAKRSSAKAADLMHRVRDTLHAAKLKEYLSAAVEKLADDPKARQTARDVAGSHDEIRKLLDSGDPDRHKKIAGIIQGHTLGELRLLRARLGLETPKGKKLEVIAAIAARAAGMPEKQGEVHEVVRRLTVDEAEDRVRTMLENNEHRTPDGVKEIARMLQHQLRVADIHQLKKRLGLQATGTKKELADAIALRAGESQPRAEKVAAPEPAKPTPPPPPPPPKPKSAWEGVRSNATGPTAEDRQREENALDHLERMQQWLADKPDSLAAQDAVERAHARVAAARAESDPVPSRYPQMDEWDDIASKEAFEAGLKRPPKVEEPEPEPEAKPESKPEPTGSWQEWDDAPAGEPWFGQAAPPDDRAAHVQAIEKIGDVAHRMMPGLKMHYPGRNASFGDHLAALAGIDEHVQGLGVDGGDHFHELASYHNSTLDDLKEGKIDPRDALEMADSVRNGREADAGGRDVWRTQQELMNNGHITESQFYGSQFDKAMKLVADDIEQAAHAAAGGPPSAEKLADIRQQIVDLKRNSESSRVGTHEAEQLDKLEKDAEYHKLHLSEPSSGKEPLKGVRAKHQLLRDEHDRLKEEVRDTLASEKARAKTSAKKAEVDAKWRRFEESHDERGRELSKQAMEEISSHPEYKQEQELSKERLQQKRSEDDARSNAAKERQDAATWQKVQERGGADKVLAELEAELRKARGVHARASESNKWRYQSRIDSISRDINAVTELAKKFPKTVQPDQTVAEPEPAVVSQTPAIPATEQTTTQSGILSHPSLAHIDVKKAKDAHANVNMHIDDHVEKVRKAELALSEAKEKLRFTGSRQPEKRQATKAVNEAQKRLNDVRQAHDDYYRRPETRKAELEGIAVDEKQPDFVRVAAANESRGKPAADDIRDMVRKHLEAGGHDIRITDAVAMEVSQYPMRAAKRLGELISGETTRQQMSDERKAARDFIPSLNLMPHHAAEAEREAGSLYAGSLDSFKERWTNRAEQHRAEQERQAKAKQEAEERQAKEQVSKAKADAYIAAMRSGGDKPELDTAAAHKVIDHILQQDYEWRTGGEMPKGKNAKALTEYMNKESGNGRFALAKTITEQGWATDTKQAIKATPAMVEHAKKLGIDKIEGRTPPVKDILSQSAKAAVYPAKVVATQINPQNGEHNTLVESEEGHQAVLDSQYLANIMGLYPDAEMRIAAGHSDKPVMFFSKGEPVGIIMPLSGHDKKYEYTSAPKLGLADALEPGPYSVDDVEEMGGTLRVGRGDKQMILRVVGSKDGSVYLTHGGFASPNFPNTKAAIAAGKELLAHAHGLDEEGEIIFKPKGQGGASLEGDEKARRDYYANLREKVAAHRKVKAVKTENGDHYPVGEHFGVRKAVDDKGKPAGWDVVHLPTNLSVGNWTTKEAAVGHAHVVGEIPGADWGTLTDSKADPERTKRLGGLVGKATKAYEDDELPEHAKRPPDDDTPQTAKAPTPEPTPPGQHGNTSKPDQLHGGRADSVPDAAIPAPAMAEGTQHEREHTSDPALAKEIAKDHLAEDPAYYDKLKQVEESNPASPKAEAEPAAPSEPPRPPFSEDDVMAHVLAFPGVTPDAVEKKFRSRRVHDVLKTLAAAGKLERTNGKWFPAAPKAATASAKPKFNPQMTAADWGDETPDEPASVADVLHAAASSMRPAGKETPEEREARIRALEAKYAADDNLKWDDEDDVIDAAANNADMPAQTPTPAKRNPFREQHDELQKQIDRLTGGTAHDESMRNAFPFGTGRPGNASSRRTSAQSAQRIEKTIDNAKKANELIKRRNELKAKADQFDSGIIDEHGRETQETLNERKKKQDQVTSANEAIAAHMRETLKPGDTVYLQGRPLKVARVNAKSVTTEGGTKWNYDELQPPHPEGRPMTTREIVDLARSRMQAAAPPANSTLTPILAEHASAPPRAKDAIESALYNAGVEDPANPPSTHDAKMLARRLASEHQQLAERGGTPDELAAVERAAIHAGLTKVHEPGQTMPFDPVIHASDEGISEGIPVTVKHAGWRHDSDGETPLVRPKVEKVKAKEPTKAKEPWEKNTVISVAGANFTYTRTGDDGTIYVKNDNGDEFDISPEEAAKAVVVSAPKTPAKSPNHHESRKNDYVDARLGEESIAARSSLSAVRQKLGGQLADMGVKLPVGISPEQYVRVHVSERARPDKRIAQLARELDNAEAYAQRTDKEKSEPKGVVGTKRFTHEQVHKKFVESALAAGKPVPPEVLADYPDLAAKHGKAASAAPEHAPVIDAINAAGGPDELTVNSIEQIRRNLYPQYGPKLTPGLVRDIAEKMRQSVDVSAGGQKKTVDDTDEWVDAPQLDASQSIPHQMPANDDDLAYQAFAAKYRDGFKQWRKYKHTEAGHEVWAEKMAEMHDAHPEFVERFEKEQEDEHQKHVAKTGGVKVHNADVVVETKNGKKEKLLAWPFHRDLRNRLREGKITAAELKQHFEVMTADPVATKQHLRDVLKKTGMRSADRINEQADSIYDHALQTFNLGGMVSYHIPIGQPRSEWDKAKIDAYRRVVEPITDEQIQGYAAGLAANRDAAKKALTNPETPEEFRHFLRHNTEANLTPEQAAKWDEIQADERRTRDAADRERAATVAGVHAGVGYEIHEGFHTKHQKPLHIVKLSGRVDSPTFKTLAENARKLGGNYQQNSKWTKGKSPDGFNFDTREQAERFGKLLGGESVSRLEDWDASRHESRQATADRLRGLAERTRDAADETLSRDRLTNTHRRAEMAASAESGARSRKAFAETVARVADAIAEGKVKHLLGIRAGTHLEALDAALRQGLYAANRKWNTENPNASYTERQHRDGRDPDATDIAHVPYPHPWFAASDLYGLVTKMKNTPGAKRLGEKVRKWADAVKKEAENTGDRDGTYIRNSSVLEELSDVARNPSAYGLDRSQGDMMKYKLNGYMRLQAADIKTPAELRAALREYLPLKQKPAGEDPVKAAERNLIGKPIAGFFPTPRPAIDDMLDRADIQPGMTVLEPSAGKGDILDAVREKHPDANAFGIEHNSMLAGIVRLKGHNIQHRNFMDVPTSEFATDENRPDRIVMNPPFENGQDIDHVRHAYDLLKPGGKMVAIMSEGPFFREDKKASGFRDWLTSVNAEHEVMPEGSFAGADSFRQTGVRTRMVTIEKPM